MSDLIVVNFSAYPRRMCYKGISVRLLPMELSQFLILTDILVFFVAEARR